jgi:hypothetical protein
MTCTLYLRPSILLSLGLSCSGSLPLPLHWYFTLPLPLSLPLSLNPFGSSRLASLHLAPSLMSYACPMSSFSVVGPNFFLCCALCQRICIIGLIWSFSLAYLWLGSSSRIHVKSLHVLGHLSLPF